MADYTVIVARSSQKELESLPLSVIKRIAAKIDGLVQQPRPAGCRKLRDENNLWRIRIGDYRVIYEIDDARRIVAIRAVRHRREAYD